MARVGVLSEWPLTGGAMDHEGQTGWDLEGLKDQLTDYYQTYYAELRSQLSDWNQAALGSLPEGLAGHKRIVAVLGKDGIVVTHWPSGQDSFDFHISPEKTAQDLVAEQCGGERLLDYPPGTDFGTYEIGEPLRLVVDGQTVWTSEWTRMEIASRPDAWLSTDEAREAAVATLLPYSEPPPSPKS